jgi:hypothetical protein
MVKVWRILESAKDFLIPSTRLQEGLRHVPALMKGRKSSGLNLDKLPGVHTF